MGKRNPELSSQSRKSRKAHFGSHSAQRRVQMSASLSKDLRKQYGVKSLPIRKGDEIVRGDVRHGKGRDGKITKVRRMKWTVYVDQVNIEKKNGQTVPVGIHPSNVVITSLFIDERRKKFIENRKKHRDQALNKLRKSREAMVQRMKENGVELTAFHKKEKAN